MCKITIKPLFLGMKCIDNFIKGVNQSQTLKEIEEPNLWVK